MGPGAGLCNLPFRETWRHLLCFLGAVLSPPLCLFSGPWHSEKDYFNPCGKWDPKYGLSRAGGIERLQLRTAPPAPPPQQSTGCRLRPSIFLLLSLSHPRLLPAPCPSSHPLFVQEPSVFCQTPAGDSQVILTCLYLQAASSLVEVQRQKPLGEVLGALSRGGDI